MSAVPLILIYACMVVFDFAVLSGTAYLIAERGWSAWWMLLALVMCLGSNPKNMINAWHLKPACQDTTLR
jgi:hypothetical protein